MEVGVSELTDRLKLMSIKKGYEMGASKPDDFRLIFEGFKYAYYKGDKNTKETFRKEMDKLGL